MHDAPDASCRTKGEELPEPESKSSNRAPSGTADQPPGTAVAEHNIRPDLRHDEVVHGTRPGDRYIRQSREVGSFRRKGRGLLSASLETDQPRSRWGRRLTRIKRTLVGEPIHSDQSIHERLTKAKALAILSSDPLSSVAYATEEILRVLLLAGAGAITALTLPIGLAIVILLAIVATSYRQTIAAYPRGGGSYIVTKDNLGTFPGLTAAASILIDYTLTVAVSVSAGIAALYSLFPEIFPFRVEICIVIIVLITIINLRGVREVGQHICPTNLSLHRGYSWYDRLWLTPSVLGRGRSACIRPSGRSAPLRGASCIALPDIACVYPGLYGADGC